MKRTSLTLAVVLASLASSLQAMPVGPSGQWSATERPWAPDAAWSASLHDEAALLALLPESPAPAPRMTPMDLTEPSTIAIFATGLMVLWLRRQRETENTDIGGA